MERKPVTSSNVHSVGYDDDETKVLEVKFNNGKVYRYADVPAELHEELMASSSVGSFLHARIKTAGYKVEQVVETEPEKLEEKEAEGEEDAEKG